jgi:hypothetical protein
LSGHRFLDHELTGFEPDEERGKDHTNIKPTPSLHTVHLFLAFSDASCVVTGAEFSRSTDPENQRSGLCRRPSVRASIHSFQVRLKFV